MALWEVYAGKASVSPGLPLDDIGTEFMYDVVSHDSIWGCMGSWG